VKLRILILSGAHRGHEIEFSSPRTFVIGRSNAADIQLYDTKLSRRHCAFKVEDGGVQFMDLGTANGTFLNGARVTQGVLADKDLLRLGDVDLQVRLERPVAIQGHGPRPAGPVCEVCRQAIPAADLAQAAHRKGRHVCARCRGPRAPIPGYALGRCLGEGTAGTVFEATAENGDNVAIKVLRSRGPLEQEDKERFLRSVETTLGFTHPNVVRILSWGATPGSTFYIVMELVRGESLRKRIDRLGPLPVPVALHIARQVGSALEEARKKTVLHRNVKPEKILVSEECVAKLTDFGSIRAPRSLGQAMAGEGMGVLPYQPPEQIEDAVRADHRSDVYSLGATLYHMLSGKKPFSAKSNMDFFMKILHEDPPPITDVRQDVPPIVLNMVAKCMKKKPGDRYQTAGELVAAISYLFAEDFVSGDTPA
jgi:hypothetical protein